MSSKIPVAVSFTGVANFLGVVGIIGSLIFVAIELQQNQNQSQNKWSSNQKKLAVSQMSKSSLQRSLPLTANQDQTLPKRGEKRIHNLLLIWSLAHHLMLGQLPALSLN